MPRGLENGDPNVPVIAWCGGLSMVMDSLNEVSNNRPPKPYDVLVDDYLDSGTRKEMVTMLRSLAEFLESV